MSDEPRLVSKKQLKTILDQMSEASDVHVWSAAGVVRHFAYLLPEDKRFTEADVEVVICKTNIGQAYPSSIMGQLQQDHVLVLDVIRHGIFAPVLGRYIRVYFMPKSVRIAYELQIWEARQECEPERRGVSERLRGLKSRLANHDQEVFLDETLKCLMVNANRAAIVMGWNLAFEHLRQWIFRHKLEPFNNELTDRLEKKNKYYDPVVDYQDFSSTSEWIVLDICEKAKLIEGHERNVLQAGLKERNHYAHPTPAVATPAIAAGHIENLLEHVVLNSKFVW